MPMSPQDVMNKWDGATLHRMMSEYKDLNPIGFRGTTRPLKSVQSFVFTVLNGLGGPPAVMAHAVARAGQQATWFGFGIGDALPLGAGLQKVATDADTNLGKARNTNGLTDFVIQAISCSCKAVRIQYAAADIPAAVVDPDARNAYLGLSKLNDPGSLIMVPQGGSPVMLEDLLMQAILPNIDFRLTWDRSRFIPVGTLEQVPEGGGRSFLRANGVPETMNRYKAFEGYPWRRKDKPDSDFVIEGMVRDPVVVPIANIALSGAAAPLVQPLNLFVDIVMRVHGVGLEQISQM
jgi:hypothetical protein